MSASRKKIVRKKPAARKTSGKSPAGKTTAGKSPAKKTPARKAVGKKAAANTTGPVTLEEARAQAGGPAPRRAVAKAPAGGAIASPQSVHEEKVRLRKQRQREDRERIRKYKETLEIMKKRGVEGLPPAKAQKPSGAVARKAVKRAGLFKPKLGGTPLQILAEGDSWFDYPVPFFGGGIISRLESRLGVPILNLAKAGDEVRYMLGVEQRQKIARQLRDGCPAGGPWEVMLFSGGGNDIVDNPMALWIRDFKPGVSPAKLLHATRYATALDLVRAGYEDLIALRDAISPSTHLMFHAYDFAIPDGRGVCHLGPWLRPTFDVHGFPRNSGESFAVVKLMLQQLAGMLRTLETSHKRVTFINGQGTLTPQSSSWHNELHPSKDGFDKFAELFHSKIKALFPGRVL